MAFVACISSHVVDGQHSWGGSTEWGVVDSSIKAGYTYLAMLFTSFMSALLGNNLRYPDSIYLQLLNHIPVLRSVLTLLR